MRSSTMLWATRFLLVVFCLMGSTVMLAQSTGGRVLGRVADPTGAVLANVTVRLINEATGGIRETKTNAGGDYSLLEVAPGSYTAEFEQTGFKKNVQKNVTVEVNSVVTLNSTLQVGATQETVEVTSEAPLVDTTSTQLGAVVNERAVTQLPLNSRDTYQLLQLQPGVQSQIGSDLFYGSDRAGVVSVNGGRGRSNNYSVNGGDGNDQFANLPQIQPTPDSIQEFRVLTNTFDAEYGRNSGAVVNVVTKSGTNQLHGSVYEFFRNKVLNARGFFDLEKPDFKQNQFGGTLGGPIKKDRTFFFASYEGRRLVHGVSSGSVTVPTDLERLGDFSGETPFAGTIDTDTAAAILNERSGCAADTASAGRVVPIATGANYSDVFINNIIPTSCQDPVAVDLLRFVPHGNLPDGSFSGVPVSRDTANQFTVRLDHRINAQQQFSAYYYFTENSPFDAFAKFEAGGANIPGFGASTKERIQQINLSHTWTLSNNTINEFRFTYFREGQGTFLHPQHTDLVTNSCIDPAAKPFCFTGKTNTPNAVDNNVPAGINPGITPGLGANREGVPFISIFGEYNLGNNFEGEIPQVGNTFQWSDNLTKVIGNHTAKFGADIRRQRFDQTLYFNVNGSIYFFGGTSNDVIGDNLMPNYLLGFPDQYQQGSAQTENVRSTALYLFAQDSWKIRRNVTLNYGLRWELNTPLTDISHRVQTFRPGQSTQIYPCVISDKATGPVLNAFGAGSSCDPGTPGAAVYPTGLVFPGDKGVPAGLTQTYRKAFAPRIGIAWSPGTSGKTSIRAGWGLFYNPIEQLVLEQFSAEPPFGGSPFINSTLLEDPFFSQNFSNDGIIYSNPFNGFLEPKSGTPVDFSLFRPILLYGQFQPNMRTQYSAQYNLNIQRELAKDLVLQVGYVGSQGHRLLATHDINFGNPQTCLDLQAITDNNPGAGTDCGQFGADFAYTVPAGVTIPAQGLHLPYGPTKFVPAGVLANDITLVGLRPYSSPNCDPMTGTGCPPDSIPVFSSVFAQDTIANSDYNSFQAMVEKRFSKGLQLQAAYTWSKSFDNASSFEGILNPIDPRASRSLSQFDARHRFVLSYYWDLPIPKYAGFTGKVLNGWAVSGITTFQSGFPIRITSQDDNELMNSFDFELPGEPDQLSAFRTQNPHSSGCAYETGPTAPAALGPVPCSPVSNQYFDPNIFSSDTDVVPSLFGRIGNAKRTICCGPGINSSDISLQKTTPITESTHVEFRADFFNLANHTQFLNPDGNITDGSDFGRIKRVRDPRQIQFALKFYF
jgi:carboxypeptidase family protein